MTWLTGILVVLLLITIILCYIGVVLHNIDRKLAEWRTTWGQNPLGASDFHAKEILKATEEVSHYLALEKLDRDDRNRLAGKP